MTRALPRTHFHGSTLIRCLADLAIADGVDAGDAFAEKLGSWIHFTDAITLHAVHGDGIAHAPRLRPDARRAAQAEATREFERIRAALANAIVDSCSPGAGKTHIALPEPAPGLPPDLAAAYLPYRRFYEAHQRHMEAAIQPLRNRVRAALAKGSARLAKLAELDATLEKILRERESKLLSRLPLLLKKRFEQSFKEHQQALADAGQADDPAARTQAWLAHFCRDMQTLLLAELELRLQPALGLIEAFKQETQ